MIKKLHDSFEPSHYDLSLKINSEQLTFTGSVEVRGLLLQKSSSVELHSKDLTINTATIGGEVATHKSGKFDTLILTVPENIAVGETTITVEFSGKITDDMAGIYPCYFEHDGVKKWLIATQFESHHAREVFPCVDEPSAKATFSLTLETATGAEVLSNMPVKHQHQAENDKTLLITTFETTPKMSTYLLAFVTGEMHNVEGVTKDGLTVRSWASVAQPKNLLDYSVKEASDTIEFYNEYFETPYPLAKCDQVALPDFDAGAMENWGLITYRETALLADPENRSISSEHYISTVIAHELSHQWFGNLVTMQWWDDLWLNESFASLMEYIAVDHIHPQWHAWEDYTAADVIAASNRDVYTDVQPVRIDVNDPAEIGALFDGAIVYAKGGRLLKMLREYIGETAFRNGLKTYFKKHAYSNTVRDDLWNELEIASNKPIKSIMTSWLEQSGMPRLQVFQQGRQLNLKQERLLLDANIQDKQLWSIPLLANNKLNTDMISTREITVQAPSEDPVLFNLSGSGHFVVDYEDKADKKALAEAIQTMKIDASGRINTLNDIVLLARSNNDSLVSGLDIVAGCQNETRDSVWGPIGTIIGHARMLTEGDETTEKRSKEFVYQLVEKQHKTLGWDRQMNDDPNTTQLRRTMAGLALSSENQQVIEIALQRYNKTTPDKLNAEFRSVLMSAAARFGSPDVVDTLIKLHNETTSADLRDDICGALTTTKDPEVAKKLLTLLKDKEQVRPQDIVRWYAYLLRNKHSRNLTWQWLIENWIWLTETFASSKSYDYFPRYAASFMNSEEWLGEYKKFFMPKINDPALARAIKIGVSEIEARVQWRKRDEKPIADWFASRSLQ